MPRTYIDLDALSGASVVVTFENARVPVSRERLLELLAAEARLIALETGAVAPEVALTSVVPHGDHAAPMSSEPLGRSRAKRASAVSHASLSYRIKRMHDLSAKAGRLRPAHAGFLTELLSSFDWVIPANPNTRLEVHLAEMSRWEGVGPELRSTIQRFVESYVDARKRA